eukprot:gene3730-biopygen3667
MPDLESASDSDSDGMSDSCDSIIYLDSGSDSDFGDDPLPSDTWAYGMYRTRGAHRVEMACGAHAGPARPRSTVGKSATKHIFNSVENFNSDPKACETFKVVHSQAVPSSGSGSVTFAKRDIQPGRMVGLQLLGTHCIPGQSFNLLSVVALEDAGFLVDFGARTVSKGRAAFSFARIGNQYIIHADYAETLDTYLACAIQHDGDQRDRFDWKFEDTEPHFTTHGPFFLELSASEDNHILDTYCTSSDTCFIKDWAGKRRYGNPPFDHDNILKCLQKALGDFDMDPANTKFMFVLPELTKAIRPSVKPTGRELSKELGSLVWSDTCGPFRISASGYRWFALFVDDSTTWICIYFLKHKSDYLEAFKLYLVEVKRLRSGMGFPEDYHTILHTDGDNTMIAGHTTAFCKERGIEQRHGSPYLHANQARVERSHRDVQAMAKALLLTSGFGVEMWPLAARHAVFILNRIFRKSLDWTSAYYLIYKKHADLSQLRIFGCLAYPFIEPTVREHKLSNRARELRYVGHSEVSSANLLYAHDSDKVVNSGMVTFSERLDKLGKVVTTWDPSAPVPLKTNFMATARDSPYRDPLPTLLETPFLEQGVYLPEDGDEVMAVVKDEVEALVQIKGARLMMKEEDVPAGVKLLDMSLILKMKLD